MNLLAEDVEQEEPTEEEIVKYAEWLGLDIHKDKDLMWIAHEGLRAPLPEGWKPCRTEEGDIYYFNFNTGESIWDHPLDEYYKRMALEEKAKRDNRTQKQKIMDENKKKMKTPTTTTNIPSTPVSALDTLTNNLLSLNKLQPLASEEKKQPMPSSSSAGVKSLFSLKKPKDTAVKQQQQAAVNSGSDSDTSQKSQESTLQSKKLNFSSLSLESNVSTRERDEQVLKDLQVQIKQAQEKVEEVQQACQIEQQRLIDLQAKSKNAADEERAKMMLKDVLQKDIELAQKQKQIVLEEIQQFKSESLTWKAKAENKDMLDMQLKELQQSIHEAQLRKTQFQQDVDRTRKELQLVEQANKKMQEEHDAQMQVQKTQEKLRLSLDESIQSLQSTKQKHETELSTLKQSLSSTTSECNSCKLNLESLQREISHRSKEQEILVQDFANKKAVMDAQMQQLQSEKQTLEQKCNNIKAELSQANTKHQEQAGIENEELKHLKTDYELLKFDFNTKSSDLESCKKEKAKTEKELIDLRSKVVKLELTISQHEQQMQVLQDSSASSMAQVQNEHKKKLQQAGDEYRAALQHQREELVKQHQAEVAKMNSEAKSKLDTQQEAFAKQLNQRVEQVVASFTNSKDDQNILLIQDYESKMNNQLQKLNSIIHENQKLKEMLNAEPVDNSLKQEYEALLASQSKWKLKERELIRKSEAATKNIEALKVANTELDTKVDTLETTVAQLNLELEHQKMKHTQDVDKIAKQFKKQQMQDETKKLELALTIEKLSTNATEKSSVDFTSKHVQTDQVDVDPLVSTSIPATPKQLSPQVQEKLADEKQRLKKAHEFLKHQKALLREKQMELLRAQEDWKVDWNKSSTIPEESDSILKGVKTLLDQQVERLNDETTQLNRIQRFIQLRKEKLKILEDTKNESTVNEDDTSPIQYILQVLKKIDGEINEIRAEIQTNSGSKLPAGDSSKPKIPENKSKWDKYFNKHATNVNINIANKRESLLDFEKQICKWAEERSLERDVLREHAMWLKTMQQELSDRPIKQLVI